jgi:hypothetical protein
VRSAVAFLKFDRTVDETVYRNRSNHVKLSFYISFIYRCPARYGQEAGSPRSQCGVC